MKLYEKYPHEGSEEDQLLEEFLEHTNGFLTFSSDKRYQLDLPDISLKFDTLGGLIDYVRIEMEEWEAFDIAFFKEV